ncbi:hypothetical protein ACFQU1_01520 [Chelatococcus sp. GCM10030263]|uniref:hypothetical protein n=1 Tax=Chelatococcus sp. GCM10030263 TaxID=3273387 RepID=UPI00361809BA
MADAILLYIGNYHDASMLGRLALTSTYRNTPSQNRFATFEEPELGLRCVSRRCLAQRPRRSVVTVVCAQTPDCRDVAGRHLFPPEPGRRRDFGPDRRIPIGEFVDFLLDLDLPRPFTLLLPPEFSDAGRLLFRHHLSLSDPRITFRFGPEPLVPPARGYLRDLL